MTIEQSKASNVSLFRRPGCWIGFLTVIPLLIGSVFLAENLAGAYALRRVKAEIAASGIELDPLKRPLARPPDEENFCATPLLLSIDRGTAAGPEIAGIRRIARWHGFASEARIRFQSVDHHDPTDWAAVRDAVAAGDPAAGLSPVGGDPVAELSEHIDRILAPVFDELWDALPRPQAWFGPADVMTRDRLDDTVFSWIHDVRHLESVLGLRARLSIGAGHGARAAESILIQLRLAEGTDASGLAVGGMFANSIRSRAHLIVWVAAVAAPGDALPRDKWLDCAHAFRRQRPLDHLAETMEREMSSVRRGVTRLRVNPEKLVPEVYYLGAASSVPAERSWKHIAVGFIPRGWFDFNEANTLDAFLHLIHRVRDPGIGDRFSGQATSDSIRRWTEKESFPWHNLVARGVLATMVSAQGIYVKTHAIARLAEAACALEAYHIDHQAYPASLDPLVPDYLPALPADLDGKPVRYAPDPANQRYKLWSIGEDGIDDGGVEKSGSGRGPPRPWNEPLGDWVWQYPE